MKKASVLKKVIIFIVVAALLAIGTYFSMQSRKKAAFVIATTYDIPETVSQQIKNVVKSQFVGSIEFRTLDKDFVPSKKSLKDIDVLFTWNGASALLIEDFATELPEDLLLNTYTTNIKNTAKGTKKNYMLPLLLDTNILGTIKGTENYYYFSIPDDYSELEESYSLAENYSLTPLYVAGADNRELLFFISTYVEALYGSSVYKNLLNLVKENQNLELCLDQNLSSEQTPLTFREILSEIKLLATDKTLNANWLTKTNEDLVSSCQQKKNYSCTMPLSFYRSLSSKSLASYNITTFPKNYSIQPHGLIAPEIVMTVLSNRKATGTLIYYFANTEIQDALSSTSGLAPACTEAELVDRLADEIRLLASSTEDGPLPDLYKGAFVTSTEADKFSDLVRGLLK